MNFSRIASTANLEGLVKKGSLSQEKMNKALSLVKGALDYSEFKNVDMVIEVALQTLISFDLHTIN